MPEAIPNHGENQYQPAIASERNCDAYAFGDIGGTETLFITAISFVALQAAASFPAAAAAITLAAITVAGDIKHPMAGSKVTNELVKDRGTGSRHWP